MMKSKSHETNTNTVKHTSNNVSNKFPKIEIGTIHIVAIFSAILLALFVFWLNRKNQQRKTFVSASEEFRNAFVQIQRAIENIELDDRYILQTTFDDIHKASIRFKGYLPTAKRTRFEKDWDAYQQHCKERVNVSVTKLISTEVLDPSKMSDPTHHREVAAMRKKQIKDHINTLLSYSTIK